MGNFISFGGGKHLDLSFLKIILYSFLPLGQIFLRINELGGSLSQWFWLLPPFLIPPFSFLSILAAKFGWIKPINNTTSSPLDWFILIPIVIKIILSQLITIINFGDYLLNITILILTLILTNLLHRNVDYKCNVDPNANSKNITKKSLFDSMLQYAVGNLCTFGVPLLLALIPGLEEIDLLFQVPVIGPILNSIIWIFGASAMYLLGNMIDINFENKQLCNPTNTLIKIFVSVFAFIAAAGWDIKSLLF
jgi:hypothetical protein